MPSNKHGHPCRPIFFWINNYTIENNFSFENICKKGSEDFEIKIFYNLLKLFTAESHLVIFLFEILTQPFPINFKGRRNLLYSLVLRDDESI